MIIITKLLLAVNILVSVLLIFVVLLQRPKNEGLGAAFGGDTATNLFGAQTTNVLANFTRWLGGIFMGLTLLLAVLYSKQDNYKTAIQTSIDAKAKAIADQNKKEEDAKKAADDAAAAAAAAATPTEGTAPAAGTPEVKPEGTTATPETGAAPAPVAGSPGAANTPAVSVTPAAPAPGPALPAPEAATPTPAPAPSTEPAK